MAFKKGESGNPAGKPPGIKNRNKQPLQNRIESLVLKNFDQIEKDIEVVAPEVRLEMIANLAGLASLRVMRTETNTKSSESICTE